MKNISLNVKFQLLIITCILVSMSIAIVIMYNEVKSSTSNITDISLHAIQNNVEKSLLDSLESKAQSLGRFMAKTSLDFILSYDLVTLKAFQEEVILDPEVKYAVYLNPNDVPFVEDQLPKSLDVYELKLPILFDDELLGYVLIGFTKNVLANKNENTKALMDKLIGSINHSREQSMNQLITRMLITIVVLLMIIILIVGLVFKFVVMSPIKRLHDGVTRIGDGDLDSHVHIASGDELGELAKIFNVMAKSLKSSHDELFASNQNLMLATKAKDEFMANMSHELRTPLNAIIGYSELLQDVTENRESLDDLAKIHHSAYYLLSLINSVLDISKVEAGRMDLYLEKFNLSALIAEVVSIIQLLVDKNNNRLVIHVQDGIDVMYGDITKIQQILNNLLSNASKFTKNGEVRLAVTMEQASDKDWVVFEISDTGIGIKKEQMGMIFNAFTQADISTVRKYGGTGLGLTICQRYCHLMGGDIGVESEYHKGSTFKVRLPLFAS